MIEKYEKDGLVAILVSPGFGAGWSTWNQKELAYDKRVVDFFINKHGKEYSEEELEQIFADWGYEDVYFGGFDSIIVEWVPKGTRFIIREYDGSESLSKIDYFDWITA